MTAKAKQIEEKLKEWEKLRAKANRINKEADGQLQDLIVTFETKAEPINAERDRKLGTVLADLQKLEQEISDGMLAEVKRDGTIGIPQIETLRALAQVTLDKKREINAAAFLRAVPPGRRQEPAFFECLNVQIGKAEKFLDKPTMDRLTKLKLTPAVAVTLKPE